MRNATIPAVLHVGDVKVELRFDRAALQDVLKASLQDVVNAAVSQAVQSGNARETVPDADAAPGVLRVEDLMRYLGLGRTAIYNLCASDSTFPPRIQLGSRAVGWRRREVDEWLASRPAAKGMKECLITEAT